ncbi:MAG: hypothetical protein MI723_02085 [Caulobacterales bacterium]|nr:hypothetical protein [Caulobacterales bacterium]
MSEPAKPDDDDVHPLSRRFLFVDSKGFRNGVNVALGAAFLGLIAVDLVVHRHGYFDFEMLTGFYALYGFIAFSFVVIMGWPLRRLLGRKETYYEDEDGDG